MLMLTFVQKVTILVLPGHWNPSILKYIQLKGNDL